LGEASIPKQGSEGELMEANTLQVIEVHPVTNQTLLSDCNKGLHVPSISEVFKIIDEFENYEISNFGRVRNMKTRRILKPTIDSDGYYKVNLCNNNNERKTFNLHQLIAKAYIANPTNKIYINHIDTNKLNNNSDNLRWATRQESLRYRRLASNNSSGIKGVYFNKKLKKWTAAITVDKIQTHLGCFESKDEAKAARQKHSKSEFGEFQNPCERD